ncbi:hypothetical protein [Alicyclobacillus sendaiensis]|uniref:hypothetical protein n=1 Tax=Alicyclobacillus sendaiensis TaxID=192387 RepID=UPI0026F41688|nr:hypothetical protein [Alicyclobacillus sendaiensis]
MSKPTAANTSAVLTATEHVTKKPMPPLHPQIPDSYTSNVQVKAIDVVPTVREVIIYNNNEFSGSPVAPTEQVYVLNQHTDKWQLIYSNTIAKLQGQFLEGTSQAPLGHGVYVVASMWSGGMGISLGTAEVLVVDTVHNKVLFSKDYQHNTLNRHLYVLNAKQLQPIIQQWGYYSTDRPSQGVAVLGATSGDVLYLRGNTVQDVSFVSQLEIASLTLPAGKYIVITPSSDLTYISSIQGNYINLEQPTSNSPLILTVKAGTYIVFNNLSSDNYSVYTNMWNPGDVQEDDADLVNGGVTPALKPGLLSFLLAPNGTIGQGLLMEVHVVS